MTRKSAIAALLLLPSFSYAATVLSAPPELNNKSYVLMDYETGQILASKNENEKLAPASMTKMMTSYIIEQKFSVHDKFHRTLILSGFCLLKIAKIS
ncbi:hypothetical protein R9425_14070, partial [Acinetobacter baumannii]|nr:hypothetical protein [Acinetobacter baumannii]